jgi:hypothetical protein
MREALDVWQEEQENTYPQRLDEIAQEAGFSSYANYLLQLKELRALTMPAGRGEPIPEDQQPTFWTELF